MTNDPVHQCTEVQRRAAALTRSPAMRGQDPHREALPVTGGAWPPTVQDAWVRARRWRA
jgi:hypothetical protein